MEKKKKKNKKITLIKIALRVILVIIILTFFRSPNSEFNLKESINSLILSDDMRVQIWIVTLWLLLIGLIIYRIYNLINKAHNHFIKNDYTFKENLIRGIKDNKYIIIAIICLIFIRVIIFNFVL